ncbi:hypothetical protein PENARI_c001G03498 [Penicillium arizonense]|uniref:Uncharacterized protein n=1 Tax=Penicillium arizonense TaxID=1835702 RepID=A0A1F5LY78_PENAI|nr:hypothetical protein PENARI_c001G03498 [Penicillium arizonense]OGE58112.1 hypothetical protein PENARI_c001G03498 [Penicillium arizonense]
MTINQRSIHAYAQGVSVAEGMLRSNPKTNCTWRDLGCDHGEVITLPRDALQMWQNEFYRDTGNYCGPVPQYVTKNATEGRSLVRQKSHVTMQNP